MIPRPTFGIADLAAEVGKRRVRFRFGKSVTFCVEGDLCFDGEWQFVLKTEQGLWAFRPIDVIQIDEEGIMVQA